MCPGQLTENDVFWGYLRSGKNEVMENHMEKNMQHDMETGMMSGLALGV